MKVFYLAIAVFMSGPATEPPSGRLHVLQVLTTPLSLGDCTYAAQHRAVIEEYLQEMEDAFLLCIPVEITKK